MNLEHTGERMVVEHYHSSIEDYVVYLMHIATYNFAIPYIENKRVLDFGCGSGYGSRRMVERAASVHAVDVSEDAIKHAGAEFDYPNLCFQQIDPTIRLPFADSTFEVVTSFQVLEHVTDVAHYLSEIRRVLTPDGCLLLATPDRTTRLFPRQRPWNRWHVREYSPFSLESTMRAFFPEVEMLQMSGRRDVIDVELHRYRKLKWMTLPFTLPLWPDSVRVPLLNVLHAIRPKKPSKREKMNFDFDESAIHIGQGVSPSLNLVAIAKNGSKGVE